MNWLAPGALLGGFAIALPFLIHMMGRGRTTVVRFPSLRFLDASRLLPERRTRIHDVSLLLLRAAAIVAAAVALAQPRVRPHAVAPAADAGTSRVVVLDTSASMQRPSLGGGSAATVANRLADSLVGNAARGGLVVRAADLRSALQGASAWAALQSGRVEIAVVSDFQRDAIDAAAVARVERKLGLQFVRVPVVGSSLPMVSRSRQGGSDVSARIAFVGNRTDVTWTVAAGRDRPSRIDVRAASGGKPGAALPVERLVVATRRAADVVGVAELPDSAQVKVAVRFSGSASGSSPQLAGPLVSRRQAGIVARMFADPLLEHDAVGDGGDGGPLRDPIVGAVGSVLEEGTPTLTVVSNATLGTVEAVSLVAAIARAASAAPVSELDPDIIADTTLAGWSRAAADRPAVLLANPAEASTFDGRWFWVLALLLIGAETVLRSSAMYPRPSVANDAG